MNAGEKCENCVFSESIKPAVNTDYLQQRIDELKKRVDGIDKQIDEELAKPRGFFGGGPNFDYVHRLFDRRINTLSSILTYSSELADAKNLMCKRFPEARKVKRDHWCGEYKMRTW